MAATIVKKFPLVIQPEDAPTATVPDGWTIIGVRDDYVYASKPADS